MVNIRWTTMGIYPPAIKHETMQLCSWENHATKRWIFQQTRFVSILKSLKNSTWKNDPYSIFKHLTRLALDWSSVCFFLGYSSLIVAPQFEIPQSFPSGLFGGAYIFWSPKAASPKVRHVWFTLTLDKNGWPTYELGYESHHCWCSTPTWPLKWNTHLAMTTESHEGAAKSSAWGVSNAKTSFRWRGLFLGSTWFCPRRRAGAWLDGFKHFQSVPCPV